MHVAQISRRQIEECDYVEQIALLHILLPGVFRQSECRLPPGAYSESLAPGVSASGEPSVGGFPPVAARCAGGWEFEEMRARVASRTCRTCKHAAGFHNMQRSECEGLASTCGLAT